MRGHHGLDGKRLLLMMMMMMMMMMMFAEAVLLGLRRTVILAMTISASPVPPLSVVLYLCGGHQLSRKAILPPPPLPTKPLNNGPSCPQSVRESQRCWS